MGFFSDITLRVNSSTVRMSADWFNALRAAGVALESATLASSGGYSITGTRASPSSIVAGTGIAFTGTSTKSLWFIQGSGGAVTVSANPQIAAGTNVGQELLIIGRHDTNLVTLNHGTGLDLNGVWEGGAGDSLHLVWDGTNWSEIARRDA